MSTSSATAAQAFKAALVTAITTAVNDSSVLVVFGQPSAGQISLFNDIVSVARVEAEQNPATYGTNRSREEILTATVVISCWRPGGPEVESVASDAAYALLEAAERYVRVTDTTVGGTVRHCFLVAHSSEGDTDPARLARGRTIEIEATFRAAVRITG